MQLRKARAEEFTAIRNFYWNLIEQMTDKENTIGWKKGFTHLMNFYRTAS